MRQLFLPACLCLMTWPGATGSDTRLNLDEFASMRSARTEAAAGIPAKAAPFLPMPEIPTATAVAASIRAAALDIPSAADTPPAVAPIAPEMAIEYPVPSNEISVVLPDVVPLPKPPPPPRPVVHLPEDVICDTLVAAAQTNDLPAPYFIRLLFQESRFRPGAVSPVGALGIAQFMPETATGMGVQNPFDPLQAIPASARLLRDLLTQFGNLGLATAAYNAGPKRIQDWLSSKGNLPEETQGYVKIITGREAENWKAPESGSPAVKLPRHAPCQHIAGLLAWDGPDEIPLPRASPRQLAAVALQRTGSGGKGEIGLKMVVAVAAKTSETVEAAAVAKSREDTAKGAVQLAARERKRAKKTSDRPASKQPVKEASKSAESARKVGAPLRLTER